jgi:4-hydroxybenzoate polyprenyltransferase
MSSRIVATFRAAHFLPTMVVTLLTFILSFRTSDFATAIGIALTFFAGQLIIGWSNDVIDFNDDLSHNRSNKPLVAGVISIRLLRYAITAAVIALLIMTFLGPLASFYGFLHLVAVVSALAYNAKLKRTIFSFLPYFVSFGLLPVIILGATEEPIQWWIPVIGALFGVGVHVANVFKDLEEDIKSGINGLPQIAGVKISRIICALCFGSSALILYSQTENQSSLLILGGALVFLLPMPPKISFPLAMVLGLATMSVFTIGIGA